jgi:hypothetical protein
VAEIPITPRYRWQKPSNPSGSGGNYKTCLTILPYNENQIYPLSSFLLQKSPFPVFHDFQGHFNAVENNKRFGLLI